jgi:hypothetical protein
MTRDQIQAAINEGIPFEIRMADAAKYRVERPNQAAAGRTAAVVFDGKDSAHVLLMLTRPGITDLTRNGKG